MTRRNKRNVVTHRDVLREIEAITEYLVRYGLADDQGAAFERQQSGNIWQIRYASDAPFGEYVKDKTYSESYAEQLDARLYNFRMLDGALMQMDYEFVGARLQRYRLAYLPSPRLRGFAEDPEAYLEDQLYNDIVDANALTVPMRFDYDGRPGVARSLVHPESHVTFGQTTNCRIATTAPTTPYYFIEFILRSFYSAALPQIGEPLPFFGNLWPACGTAEELAVVHIGVPVAR